MGFVGRKLLQPHIWKRMLLERGTEPLHLNLLGLFIALFGSVRSKILFDIYVRQQHAYGLLAAADGALASGMKSVTVIEFGVANGSGLLNICEIAAKVSSATGVSFNIVGFDNVSGMPPLRDYRDHPELYQPGWYPMQDPDLLRAKLPANAQLILGDIATTVPEFLKNLASSSPIGFVSVDVDYYWSAVEALKLFTGPPELYLPHVTVYLDDVSSPWHNRWCGELAAVADFNEANQLRKIGASNFLRENRIFKNARWIGHMYSLHVLDHPFRFAALQNIDLVVQGNPYLGLKTRG